MKLEIDSMFKSYKDRQILSGIYMQFETKKITGIFGRNGSGKSTIFNILMGIEKADSGSIRLDSVYVSQIYRMGIIKYLGQEICLPKSVKLKYFLDILNSDNKKTKNDLSNLNIDLNAKIGENSLGQQRLIELVLFLNSDAPFLILDEPFNYIMPIHIEWLVSEIKNKDSGIIVADHQYHIMLDLCEDAYLLKDTNSRYIKSDIKNTLIESGYIPF